MTQVVTITLGLDEAESLSLSLSDLLCWHSGFAAARAGTEHDYHGPMGVRAAQDLNLKIKSALDQQDRAREAREAVAKGDDE